MAEKKAKKIVKNEDVILNEVKDLDSSVLPQNDKKAEKKAVEKKPAAKKAETSEKPVKTAEPVKNKLKKSEKKHSKKYREVTELVNANQEYSVEEAIKLAKQTSTTKFDSSVEVHIRLNIDPQNSEQQVRGSIVLPAGTGKSKKVLAIVNPDKEKEAKDAGAEHVGGEDLIAKIEKGWLDFEVVVATPDMMPKLGRIGKILGTKGLMPNPKVGTVTANIKSVIEGIKKGMVEYRPDKTGIVHTIFGKVSFSEKDLVDNYSALIDAIMKAKPASLKGGYVKGISISTTMGPGIKVVQK